MILHTCSRGLCSRPGRLTSPFRKRWRWRKRACKSLSLSRIPHPSAHLRQREKAGRPASVHPCQAFASEARQGLRGSYWTKHAIERLQANWSTLRLTGASTASKTHAKVNCYCACSDCFNICILASLVHHLYPSSLGSRRSPYRSHFGSSLGSRRSPYRICFFN